jgi:hypothetical protein
MRPELTALKPSVECEKQKSNIRAQERNICEEPEAD